MSDKKTSDKAASLLQRFCATAARARTPSLPRALRCLRQRPNRRSSNDAVRTRFNTYRFADHKEAMIELLAKVVTVSLETVAITDAMRTLGDARQVPPPD